MNVRPGIPRDLEVYSNDAKRRDDKGCDRQAVREEENAAPVDAECRDIGDQKGERVDPPAPLMHGGAFRSE